MAIILPQTPEFYSTMNDPLNTTACSLWELLPNPIAKHIEMTGWGGLGMNFSRLPLLWPLFPWAIAFFLLRFSMHRLFRSLGLAMGIAETQKSKLRKFQYQCWLLMFYVCSSIFGWAVLHDKPWLGFPPSPVNQMEFVVNHPQEPDPWITVYYCYELGFFFSELVVIFHETRRSDFAEYVLHHLCTIALMVLSFVGYEHRIGSYILLIHDVSDIPLCLTKLLHYCPRMPEWFVNVNFVIFVATFAFMRLFCLPIHGFMIFFRAIRIRVCTWNFWILGLLLQVLLQGLHVYWFGLILRLIYRMLFTPFRGDIRSDSDDDAPPAKEHKKK